MKRFELIILIGAITFSLVISWLIVFNSNFFNLSGFGDDTVFSEKGCDFSIIKTTNKFLVLEKSKNTYINVLANVIKYKKKNYIVTEIRSKAFASNKHIKSVVLGKNVCLIGEKAFYRCSNLKRIQFKGNLIRKVGKKALKGISNKCRILVPKKMEKKVRKRLEKKGQNKKVTIRTKG